MTGAAEKTIPQRKENQKVEWFDEECSIEMIERREILEWVIRQSYIKKTGSLKTKSQMVLAYADDVAIITRAEEKLKEVCRNFLATAEKVNLQKLTISGSGSETTEHGEEKKLLMESALERCGGRVNPILEEIVNGIGVRKMWW
ncbi:hypothetical protein QE152_g33724 [Popillia japonica]|uniref:Reverse transcriptase domain-containing protein n=1 Tax=Popillia japonica TaxID=7064 RepID=A0AAW1IW78_POPJA